MNKGLYRRLAISNIKNNRRFYFPYLLTGIITVSMFYIIYALAENQGVEKMPGSADVRMILLMGVWVIGLFSIIFLFYTNSFIVKRRKKELGIYNILGMEKRHISRILGIETIFTMLISIGGGLITGVIFNKLMCMFLYKIIGLDAKITFYVSKKGVLLSIMLFAGIYILTFIYDLLQVKLANPIELLQGSSVGEREPKTKILMAVLGCACLGIGYYIAMITKNPIEAFSMFFIAVILVIIGTYLLFTAGSIAFLKILRKNKNYYYKTKHFTSVSGMLYRMKQNAVGLSNICILSTMVLVVVSTTVCLYLGVNDILKQKYPSDMEVYGYYTQGEVTKDNGIIPAVESGVKESGRKIRNQKSYIKLEFAAVEENGRYILDKEKNTSAKMENMTGFSILTREDYQQLYKNQIQELKDNEIVLLTTKEEKKEEIILNDCSYKVKEIKRFQEEDSEELLNVMDNYYYIIVNDVDDLEKINKLQMDAYKNVASSAAYYYRFDIDGTEKEKRECFTVIQQKLEEADTPFGKNLYSDSRQERKENAYVLYGGFFFLGLFLGALFLMITVLIIFYKQISEGYEDKERFAIMEKVGMSNQEVKSTIRSQIRTVFLLPILMAAVHIAAAFPMIRRLLTLFSLTDKTLFAQCTVGTILVFFIIYLVVFMWTSKIYYKIVGEQV